MNEYKQTREPDTERRILEAAAKVFMLKGKLGASMQDIADEAGINRTLLHYYFRNKDNLFDTVFKKLVDQVLPAMIGIMSSDKSFQERIEGFIDAYSNLLQENPYLPVFIFQEITLNPERIANAIHGTGLSPGNSMSAFKEELEKAGMEDADPRHILANMVGMVLFPYISRPLFQSVAFQGDDDAFEQFLAERRKHIPNFIKLAILGSGVQNQES